MAIARIEMDLIDTMIEAAHKLNEAIFPSYAVPRIWRMSAGWVYEIAPEAAGKWSVALPDNFVNVPEVYIRDTQEGEAESKVLLAEDAASEQEMLDAEDADARSEN